MLSTMRAICRPMRPRDSARCLGQPGGGTIAWNPGAASEATLAPRRRVPSFPVRGRAPHVWRLRDSRRDCPRRHGGRVQGAADQPRPHRRPQDDPRGRALRREHEQILVYLDETAALDGCKTNRDTAQAKLTQCRACQMPPHPQVTIKVNTLFSSAHKTLDCIENPRRYAINKMLRAFDRKTHDESKKWHDAQRIGITFVQQRKINHHGKNNSRT